MAFKRVSVHYDDLYNMLDEIKNRYKTFGDAGIEKIEYQHKHLVIYMNCLNHQTGKWENVKFEFISVSSFRYIESLQLQNSIVFEALFINEGTDLIVDFYPIQVDGLGKLEADPNSSFQIHCSDITYEVLSH
jgi:hypothetical protein